MLDQFTNSDRNLIYSKIAIELVLIVLVIYNFYSGIFIVPLAIIYIAVRLFQYNQKTVEDLLCL